MKYDNCKILDQQGKHIFNCDQKKAEWYLKQGYGDKVSEKPLIIQFNFSNPEENASKFDGWEELYNPDFYLQDKENICGVCGS